MRTQEDDVACALDPHVTRSSDVCMTVVSSCEVLDLAEARCRNLF